MDIKNQMKKISNLMFKYRYPLIIVFIGLGLLLIPVGKQVHQPVTPQITDAPQQDLVQQLTDVLAQIEGVGKVRILLTVAAGEKTYYQHDENTNTGDSGSSLRQETVIITDAQRNQQALITQVVPPKYQGAIVVCQGAHLPMVKLAIVEAVSKATGLGADEISVLKMK